MYLPLRRKFHLPLPSLIGTLTFVRSPSCRESTGICMCRSASWYNWHMSASIRLSSAILANSCLEMVLGTDRRMRVDLSARRARLEVECTPPKSMTAKVEFRSRI